MSNESYCLAILPDLNQPQCESLPVSRDPHWGWFGSRSKGYIHNLSMPHVNHSYTVHCHRERDADKIYDDTCTQLCTTKILTYIENHYCIAIDIAWFSWESATAGVIP